MIYCQSLLSLLDIYSYIDLLIYWQSLLSLQDKYSYTDLVIYWQSLLSLLDIYSYTDLVIYWQSLLSLQDIYSYIDLLIYWQSLYWQSLFNVQYQMGSRVIICITTSMVRMQKVTGDAVSVFFLNDSFLGHGIKHQEEGGGMTTRIGIGGWPPREKHSKH